MFVVANNEQAMLAWSGDAPKLLSCNKTLQLWDVRTGKRIKQFGNLKWEVAAAALSASGRLALTSCLDPRQSPGIENIIDVWDTDTGRKVNQLVGHQDGISSLTFLPGDKKAVSGSRDGTVRVWDL